MESLKATVKALNLRRAKAKIKHVDIARLTPMSAQHWYFIRTGQRQPTYSMLKRIEQAIERVERKNRKGGE